MIAMDELLLLEIEKRLCTATSGPWISFVEGRDHMSGSSFIKTADGDIELSGATIADQDFIAHARTDIENLIFEIRRLKNVISHQK
jgi:hypothetical protein